MRDLRAEFAGDDGLDDRMRGRELRFSLFQHETDQQRADLIARQQAVRVVVTHRNAQPVRVRIRSEDEVGSVPLRKADRQFQRAPLLRIRRDDGRKRAVRLRLFRDERNAGKPVLFEDSRYRVQPAPWIGV